MKQASFANTPIIYHSTVTASQHQVSTELAGEEVILDLKNGVYYGLDVVGTHIWKLIQEPKAVNEVIAALLQEYDVDAEQCADDVLVLLQDLAEHNLIEVTHETPV